MSRIILHIDANAAYLSWEAAYRLQHGEKIDLRTIPSIVGGSEKSRHGIVLAKSIPAKKYGIKTGEPVRDAFSKCPNLVSVPPRYNIYMNCSNAMVEIFKEYTDKVQRYSIDECFLDMTHSLHLFSHDPVKVAHEIKDRIKKELGFTVNVGIGVNKLQAKVASDFKKPDMVHTLYPHEIEKKMWPLPVGDLFMVGMATKPKLFKLGIYTIGDLANTEKDLIHSHLKSHGLMIWHYANGIDYSDVRKSNYEFIKGIGNGTTTHFDVDNKNEAYKVLLALTESVAMRLRAAKMSTQLVTVGIKTNEFRSSSHQRKLGYCTDTTYEIYEEVKRLFDDLWDGETPLRKLRVRVSELTGNDFLQMSLFDINNREKLQNADLCIDAIRKRFGSKSVIRASFLYSGISPIQGGMPEDDYPLMSSIL
ncbi:DNA polymerase IV (plasmid) [Vallitalea pronyensis]|uniref:DNA polymerase IV n=1 Tax=Vallitalea pronyensis TaxID=1348613 RepID=A0A8J8MQD1_9FIRM|nr:DNA polymerase IV [Vallitalea pronyensis]QUI25925.1 DNA polymerase IV [Vallitalea pronyensis]